MVKRMRIIILVAIILVLCTGTVGAYQAMVKKVTVMDNEVQDYSTTAQTVELFLVEQNIEIKEYDELNLALNTPLTEGVVIKIDRAVPVSITIDGSNMDVMTCRATVADLLDEKHVVLGDKDIINYKLDDKISTQMIIDIKTYQELVVTESETIAFTTEKREVYNIPVGEQKIIQQGVAGEKVFTYNVVYLAGKEISKDVALETITKEPVKAIVEVGTKNPISTVSTPNGQLEYSQVMTFKASAYTPLEGGGNGITASGMKARYGVVAVDPNVIPLYTKLYIEGYGIAIAGDTGGAIQGKRVDLCYETYNEAIQFGRRNVKIYVLK